MNAVEFIDVTRRYPKNVTALNGVSLTLPEGAVCGLVGRNGAGKTTLLRMIPALLHPTTGEVRVFGMDPWQAQEEVKKQLGYLSESEVLPGNVRIKDMTDFCASIYPNWDGRMAEELAARFGLESRRKIGALSKGQKRQVGLICAVCHRPRLLVLDEPASGLDPVARRDLLEVVINLLSEAGSTVFFSSHILSDLDRIAERLVILHEGRILLDQMLDDVKENICRVEVAAELSDQEIAALRASPICLSIARKNNSLRLALRCPPSEAPHCVKQLLPGLGDGRLNAVVPLGLEDIFVELTGGRQ